MLEGSVTTVFMTSRLQWSCELRRSLVCLLVPEQCCLHRNTRLWIHLEFYIHCLVLRWHIKHLLLAEYFMTPDSIFNSNGLFYFKLIVHKCKMNE